MQNNYYNPNNYNPINNNDNKTNSNSKSIISFVIIVIIIIGCIRIIMYFMNNSSSNSNDIDTALQQEFDKAYKDTANKFYKGDENWKYVQDPDDSKCLTNWSYYDTDKKTPIQKDISRITSIEKGNDWCATTIIPSKDQQNVPDYSYENTEDYIAMATGFGISVASAMILSKLLKSTLYKTIKTTIVKKLGVNIFSKVAGRAISKTFQSISKTVFKPLLNKGFSKIALAGAKRLGASVGKTAAKIGAKATGSLVKIFGKTALKAGLRFRPSPTVLLDILTISLDIFDAGGYDKLQYKNSLYKTKKAYNDAFKTAIYEVYKKQFDEMNKDNPTDPIKFTIDDLEWPMVINPLDNIEEDLYESYISQEMDMILENPLNKHSIKFYAAIAEDIESGILKESDLSNEDIYEDYLDKYIDYDTIIDELYANWCVKNGGLVYEKNKCTLPDNKCTLNWPIPLDTNGEPQEQYREFRDGKCIVVDPSVRKLCDQMNIPYDFKTGICKIDENYCKSKGAEWKFDAQLQDYDCKIPLEQKIFEFMFGTTVTRGLKQVFDAEQYENCGFDGEFKINGKCLDVSSNKVDENGTSVQIWDCNKSNGQKFYYNSKDKYIHPMANYNKCLSLNKENVLEISDCSDANNQHFYFDENTKQFQLMPDKNKCIQLIDNNMENGTQFTIKDCINDTSQKFNLKRDMLNDISLSCEINRGRTADCPPTYTNNGLTCGRSADTKKGDSGRVADCPKGYTNTGASCLRMAKSLGNIGRVADCEPGYTNNGATCGKGARSIINVGRVADCPATYTNTGAMCARSAKSFGNTGSRGNCPPGYNNTGLSCLRPASSKSAPKSSGLAKCGNGYDNMGTYCYKWWPPSSKSLKDDMCPAGYTVSKINGKCYEPCGEGYTNTGITCYRGPATSEISCPDGMTKRAGLCYKNCVTEAKKRGETAPEKFEDMGLTCYRKPSTGGMSQMTCKDDEYKSGARCYKKCEILAKEKGYVNGMEKEFNQLPGSCYRPPSTKGMGSMHCYKKGTTEENPIEFRSSARCYKKCEILAKENGYEDTANKFDFAGGSCFRPASTLNMSEMKCFKPGTTEEYPKEEQDKRGARCYKPCPEGYTNTGVSCFKPASTKGLDSMKCLNKDGNENKDERMIGGRCYPKCPPDYTNMGVHCTRRKYRKVAFSTKNN